MLNFLTYLKHNISHVFYIYLYEPINMFKQKKTRYQTITITTMTWTGVTMTKEIKESSSSFILSAPKIANSNVTKDFYLMKKRELVRIARKRNAVLLFTNQIYV